LDTKSEREVLQKFLSARYPEDFASPVLLLWSYKNQRARQQESYQNVFYGKGKNKSNQHTPASGSSVPESHVHPDNSHGSGQGANDGSHFFENPTYPYSETGQYHHQHASEPDLGSMGQFYHQHESAAPNLGSTGQFYHQQQSGHGSSSMGQSSYPHAGEGGSGSSAASASPYSPAIDPFDPIHTNNSEWWNHLYHQ